MKSNDQIKLINDTINKTKENLKPLGFNLVFWGIFINILSAIHYFFGSVIFQKILYWSFGGVKNKFMNKIYIFLKDYYFKYYI